MLPPQFWGHLISIWAYGLSGLVLFMVFIRLMDFFTYKINWHDEIVNKQNTAVAIKVGAIIIGLAAIIAAVIAS